MKFNFLFKETKSVLLPNQKPGVVSSTFVTTEMERKMMQFANAVRSAGSLD